MKTKHSKALFLAVSAASSAHLALALPTLASEATVTPVALPKEGAAGKDEVSSSKTSTATSATTATTSAATTSVATTPVATAPVVTRNLNTTVGVAGKAIVAPVTRPGAGKTAPATAPVVASRLEVGALRVRTSSRPAAPASRPATLSSRSIDGERDRLLLQQLQAQLQRSKRQLNQADADLSVGQKQLMSFGNTLRQAMMEAGPEAKGLHPFVKVAQRYAGTPYVWGGESGRGFDCSGFIIRVMRDLGYRSLPHSAAEQFNYGTPIAQALLKPGDLVFFANTYKPGISHVGIYLGRRRFIHAAGTGLGTIVSSLDTPKYQAKYAGARRLVPARR